MMNKIFYFIFADIFAKFVIFIGVAMMVVFGISVDESKQKEKIKKCNSYTITEYVDNKGNKLYSCN